MSLRISENYHMTNQFSIQYVLLLNICKGGCVIALYIYIFTLFTSKEFSHLFFFTMAHLFQ